MPKSLVHLPDDIYYHMLSDDNINVLDIRTLKQTCRALRAQICSLLTDNPEIYRKKLALLEEEIPTGLPNDLSAFTAEYLEVAALSSYAVAQRWRRDCPKLCRAARFYHPGEGGLVNVLQVLPGGRWIIAGQQKGDISVWDTIGEHVVARCDTRCDIQFLELDVTGQGEIFMAITGTEIESRERTLCVYSLRLDPPPARRDDGILVKKGCVLAERELCRPAIKGSLASSAYRILEGLCILVYDWQMDVAQLLKVDHNELRTHYPLSREALSLFIMPRTILILLRPMSRSVLVFVRCPGPELDTAMQDPWPDNGTSSRSRLPSVFPGIIERILWCVSPGGINHFQMSCSIVDHLTSSSSPSSLSFISLAFGTVPGILPQILSDVTTVAESSSGIAKMTSRVLLRRATQIYQCGGNAPTDLIRPRARGYVMALGHTGRRAIWVEDRLPGNTDEGVLVGFTMPATTDSKHWDAVDHARDSPLRNLRTPGIVTYNRSIPALGFDESTATIAMGDHTGRVWVLNYGPKNAVRTE